MERIKTMTECKWCLSRLVEPVLLPCGNTVCQEHTECIKEQDWVCLLCDDEHKLADGETFPVNNLAVSLLEMHWDQLAYDGAKDEVHCLESELKAIKYAIDEPKDYVASQVSKFNIQVDLGREQLNEIVENVCKEIGQDLAQFQVEVESKMGKAVGKLMNELEPQIKEWHKKLDKQVLDPSLYKKIARHAKVLRKRIDDELKIAFEPPLTLENIPKSIESRFWHQVSSKMNKHSKSIWVYSLSQYGIKDLPGTMYSDSMSIRDIKFHMQVDIYNEHPVTCTILCLESNLDKGVSVKLSMQFNIWGKNGQIIHTESVQDTFTKKKKKVFGFKEVLSLEDIMDDPAFQDDMIRYEVVVDEESAELVVL